MSVLDIQCGIEGDPLLAIINKMKAELSAWKRPKLILFVEDFEATRGLFELLTKDFNCQVDYAEDGEIGVQKAIHGSYDLILLDINLPDINGIEIFAKIRKTLGDQPPVVFFTGLLNDAQGAEIDKIGFAPIVKNQSILQLSILHQCYIPLEFLRSQRQKALMLKI